MDSDIAMRLERSHRIAERIYIPPSKSCVVCGAFKKPGYPLCKTCREKYGYDSKSWPKWVQYLRNEQDKEIRRLRNSPEEVPPKDE